VPGTTLAIHVDDRRVEVLASDGEGTAISLNGPVDRVRVLRQRDVYAIEAHAGRASWVWHVDRAGVRVDDAIAARLLGRLPGWALGDRAVRARAPSSCALEPPGTCAAPTAPHEDARRCPARVQRRAELRRAWAIVMISRRVRARARRRHTPSREVGLRSRAFGAPAKPRAFAAA
jgi:hypothetical protein